MAISRAQNQNGTEKYIHWLSRHWADLLFAAYALFIIYCTVIPFKFIADPHYLSRRWHKIDWIPFVQKGELTSGGDMLANVIFFMPLGITLALRKLMQVYRNFYFREWLQVVFSGMGISLLVEFLQVFTYNRQPAVTDVIMNTLGTFIGAALMLVIYLKYRRPVKQFLLETFAGKPETIFSGLFLLFILLMHSAPFDFRIEVESVHRQMLRFLENPWRIDDLPGALFANFIVYGTFVYFLFSGLRRYHQKYLNRRFYFLLIGSLLALPVGIELYQFLVPLQNHSLTDVICSYLGMGFGALIWYGQTRRMDQRVSSPADENRAYYSCHLGYFKIVGILYLLFLLKHFFYPLTSPSDEVKLADLLVRDFPDFYTLIKLNRLKLLFGFLGHILLFLPAGFLLTGWWHTRCPSSFSLRTLFVAAFFLVVGLHLWGLYFSNIRRIWLDVPAAGIGLWFGYIFWRAYNYLLRINGS